ncbi:hypothetical protein LZK81_25130 (plasmid) [Neorhizobium galegae]|nr:hypothetical protein LZK81_25130 [Neorhizobium galegae]
MTYHSRHDNAELCYALFDRAADAVVEIERLTDLDQDWFWRIAESYRAGFAPRAGICEISLRRRGDGSLRFRPMLFALLRATRSASRARR